MTFCCCSLLERVEFARVHIEGDIQEISYTQIGFECYQQFSFEDFFNVLSESIKGASRLGLDIV